MKFLQHLYYLSRYVAKSTASFFGLDEETEHNSYQRWTERRRRLLSKRWGELKVRYFFRYIISCMCWVVIFWLTDAMKYFLFHF